MLFSGGDEFYMLESNATKLQNKEYYYAAVLTAKSLLHGGPGIQFFLHTTSQCIFEVDEMMLQPSISEIPSPWIQKFIEKVYLFYFNV